MNFHPFFFIPLFILSNILSANSQNLVPNPSFEEFEKLPQKDGEFTIKDWRNPNAIDYLNEGQYSGEFGTPDYLHRMANGPCKLPNSAKGRMEPKDGDGIVGLVIFNDSISNFREYITTKLIKPLTVGEQYVVSFNVNVDANNLSPYGIYYASGLGLLLSPYRVNQSKNQVILADPQKNISRILKSSSNNQWETLTFILEADKPYEYLTIGNFNNDQSTKYVRKSFQSDVIKLPGAYYFIDDVSVKPLLAEPIAEIETKKEEPKESIKEVKVGGNQIICGAIQSKPLGGKVALVSGRTGKGRWNGGLGFFEDKTNPNTTYTPSREEFGKQVTLTFVPEINRSLYKNIQLTVLDPVASISTNGDQRVKPYQTTKPLGGNIILESGKNITGIWKGGNGQFVNRTDPNTTYTPSSNEIGKKVELTYIIKEEEGICSTDKQKKITITVTDGIDKIQNGEDQFVCGMISSKPLGVLVKTYRGRNVSGKWKGGKGGFSDINNPNATYTPIKEEIGEKVKLVFETSSGVEASVHLTIEDPIYSIDAGEEQTISGLTPTRPLNANCVLLSGKPELGIWTGGKGSFSDLSSFSATYTPDESELGKVITLTYSIPYPGCSKKSSDQVRIKVLDKAVQEETKEETLDLLDVPPEKGRVIRMKTIRFGINKFKIIPQHHNELNRFAQYLNKYPNIIVEVRGHTNTKCDDEFCNKLSKNRAQAVANYFVEKGIATDRISSKGYGKQNPLSEEKRKIIQAKNQRVELKIINK